jgi:plastocyanin
MVGHKTDVKIWLEGEYVKAKPSVLNVTPGDTLQIHSTGGKHRVEFVPWTFKETEKKKGIDTNEVFTFVKSGNGDFDFYCYFTPEGEDRERKYEAGNGGHGSVRP